MAFWCGWRRGWSFWGSGWALNNFLEKWGGLHMKNCCFYRNCFWRNCGMFFMLFCSLVSAYISHLSLYLLVRCYLQSLCFHWKYVKPFSFIFSLLFVIRVFMYFCYFYYLSYFSLYFLVIWYALVIDTLPNFFVNSHDFYVYQFPLHWSSY